MEDVWRIFHTSSIKMLYENQILRCIYGRMEDFLKKLFFFRDCLNPGRSLLRFAMASLKIFPDVCNPSRFITQTLLIKPSFLPILESKMTNYVQFFVLKVYFSPLKNKIQKKIYIFVAYISNSPFLCGLSCGRL